MTILEDVVALVVTRPGGPINSKQAIINRLESLGARVASRWSKEVTHVVFQKRRSANPAEQSAEENELRYMYERAAKVDFPVAFVSPLWIEGCANEQRRVLERKFVVPRPPDTTFHFDTPGSAAGTKKVQRRRSVLPKPAEEYDVDVTDALFSSSQQIRGGITTGKGAEEVMSPMIHAAGKRRGQKRAAANFDPEREMDLMNAEIGSGTQLAAEMLTGLGENLQSGAQQVLLGMNKGKSGRRNAAANTTGQAFETPPTAKRSRRPKSALMAATTRASTGKKGISSAPQLGRGGVTKRGGAARRGASRLQAAAAAIADGATPVQGEAEEGKTQHEMPLAILSKRPRSARVVKPRNTEPSAAGPTDRTAAMIASTAALAISQPTDVQKAPSPQQRQQTSLVHNEDPMDTLEGGVTAGGKAGREAHQVSNAAAGTSCVEDARPGAARHSSRPAETPTPKLPAVQGTAARVGGIPIPGFRRVPSPWGPPPSAAAAAKGLQPAQNPETSGPWTQPRAWDRPQQQPGDLNQPGSSAEGMVMDVQEASREAGPSQGCLALSSVEEGIPEVARAAVKRLRGLHMCPDGAEDRVTHLIISQERRTLKVLLAIANGAWLLSPAWLTASLEAGHWLPEAPFKAEVRFAEAAGRARQRLQGKDARAPLLEGQRVFVHGPGSERRGVPNNGPALKRMATALGAKVATRRDCTLCLLSGGVTAPSGLPASAKVLREEWLLHTVATYSLPAEDSAWTP